VLGDSGDVFSPRGDYDDDDGSINSPSDLPFLDAELPPIPMPTRNRPSPPVPPRQRNIV
jgi:hypothetical protein